MQNEKLKLKDFVPFYGLIKYLRRNSFEYRPEYEPWNNNPDANLNASSRVGLLKIYNIIFCIGATVGSFAAAIKGIEKLL